MLSVGKRDWSASALTVTLSFHPRHISPFSILYLSHTQAEESESSSYDNDAIFFTDISHPRLSVSRQCQTQRNAVLYVLWRHEDGVLCSTKELRVDREEFFHFDVIPSNILLFSPLLPWSRRSNFIVCSAPFSHWTAAAISQRKKMKITFCLVFHCTVLVFSVWKL